MPLGLEQPLTMPRGDGYSGSTFVVGLRVMSGDEGDRI